MPWVTLNLDSGGWLHDDVNVNLMMKVIQATTYIIKAPLSAHDVQLQEMMGAVSSAGNSSS